VGINATNATNANGLKLQLMHFFRVNAEAKLMHFFKVNATNAQGQSQ
jgi:hypothetical protein